MLSLLGGEQSGGGINHVDKSTKTPQTVMMPDLIDTGDSDDLLGVQDSKKPETESRTTNATISTPPLIDDLFGGNFGGGENTNGRKLDDDPFADVSFHTSQEKDHVADLFSGTSVNRSGTKETHTSAHKTESEPFDFFNSSSEVSQAPGYPRKDVNDLMGSLSVNENDPFKSENGSSVEKSSHSVSTLYQDNKNPNGVLNTEPASQVAGINAAPAFPLGATGYNFPPGLMFNPAYASQPINYGAMGSLFAQQQFLATMANFQQTGNLQLNANMNAASNGGNSPYPDIFNPGLAAQPPTSLMNDSKREDTKAFDFISVSVIAFFLSIN